MEGRSTEIWRWMAFWMAVVVTGLGTGLATAALMNLLYVVQHTLWPGSGLDLLDAAARADWKRHLLVLLGAGLLTGAGQLLLGRLPNGNGIDVVTAISLYAGRLPALRSWEALFSRSWSSAWAPRSAGKARRSKPAPSSPTLRPGVLGYQTTTGGCWSPAAPAPAWLPPMAFRSVARNRASSRFFAGRRERAVCGTDRRPHAGRQQGVTHII